MVQSLHHQFSHLAITHLLQDDNRHADSLAYLPSKIDLDTPRIITVEMQDKPSYKPPIKIHLAKDIKRIIVTDIKDN